MAYRVPSIGVQRGNIRGVHPPRVTVDELTDAKYQQQKSILKKMKNKIQRVKSIYKIRSRRFGGLDWCKRGKETNKVPVTQSKVVNICLYWSHILCKNTVFMFVPKVRSYESMPLEYFLGRGQVGGGTTYSKALRELGFLAEGQAAQYF